MNIGNFLDVIVYFSCSIMLLYIRKKNKEKLGKKQKWLLYGAIAFIGLAVLSVLRYILPASK